MSKAKRRAQYAEKLRNNLRQRWVREKLESKRTKAQQDDLIRWALNFRKP
jgi:hypothetical protein